MIKSFRHKGLKAFFEGGSRSGIQASHSPKLSRILARLDEACCAADMNLPGWLSIFNDNVVSNVLIMTLFVGTLMIIIGAENLKATIKKYFEDFKFTHPKPLDIIRTAEKVSGLELDWYLIDFGQTTNTIDYSVKAVQDNKITLERIGLMPMPIDLTVTYTDGNTENYYIPLQMMRGEKPTSATIISDWAWAYPTYTFTTSKPVASVQIDPKEAMADINKANNSK